MLVRRSEAALLPHPVMAPVALPAGEPAFAKLQKEPVAIGKQSAAAVIAEGEEDFVARMSAKAASSALMPKARGMLLDRVEVKEGG